MARLVPAGDREMPVTPRPFRKELPGLQEVDQSLFRVQTSEIEQDLGRSWNLVTPDGGAIHCGIRCFAAIGNDADRVTQADGPHRFRLRAA
jgi:hypothetical protein